MFPASSYRPRVNFHVDFHLTPSPRPPSTLNLTVTFTFNFILLITFSMAALFTYTSNLRCSFCCSFTSIVQRTSPSPPSTPSNFKAMPGVCVICTAPSSFAFESEWASDIEFQSNFFTARETFSEAFIGTRSWAGPRQFSTCQVSGLPCFLTVEFCPATIWSSELLFEALRLHLQRCSWWARRIH
eukprot:gnl/TRDRNA2_/TRDRNA2_84783_c0_seq1.p1 gnl/TRDRNA2_/TRDRNA2_84783_c0~~gnl/TRDRNA2_/TRDRNA2_84783_c0_seq1.p1  ORF type:complete len:185 (-),score=2.24 gnl/TRDRNA2_/TRDRNA2_84783_c0_seq1:20-574(-)